MKYDLVIGVLTYNKFDFLKGFIESLYTNTPDITDLSKTVVIIANNSEDENFIRQVEELAAQYKAGTLNFRRNRGTSAAWNAIARAYDCENVIIFNDDILIHAGWKDACQPFFNRQDIGVFGLVAKHGWDNWGYRNNKPPHEASIVVGSNVIYPVGSCLAFRKDRFIEVGGFDEDFVFGVEEVDFAIRLMNLGYENLNIGSRDGDYWFISHYGSGSGWAGHIATSELRRIASESTGLLFEQKHGTPWPNSLEFDQELRRIQKQVKERRGL